MTQYSTTTQTLLNVTYAQKILTITYTTPRLARGVKMNRQFRITYETKGVKVVNVWLPEGTQLPKEWDEYNYQQQDEWLYEHQLKSENVWADEHMGQAVNILPVSSLKTV